MGGNRWKKNKKFVESFERKQKKGLHKVTLSLKLKFRRFTSKFYF